MCIIFDTFGERIDRLDGMERRMAKHTGLNRAKRGIGKACSRVAEEKKRRTRKTRQMAKRLEAGQERLNGWNVD